MNSTLDWDLARQILTVVVAFTAGFTILFTVKKIIFRRLNKWIQGGKPLWYGVLVDVVQRPLNLVVVSISLGIALQTAPESIREHVAARTSTKILLILAIFWLIDRAAGVAIKMGASSRLSEASKALFQTIARVLVVILAAMIVLDTLGISITPLLASLGIGSVAIALALQDTLSNFFGGVYVLIDKPIRVGDMVRLEDGTEGIVRRIGWRSSQIEAAGTNIVVIPNTKLASQVVTNYEYPTPQVNVVLPIGVSYNSDLSHVERVTLEVAKEIATTNPAGAAEIAPLMRYMAFADSSINFNLIVRARTFGDAFVLRHALIKAIHSRYQKERIEIPFPQRTVQMVHMPAEQSSTSAATPN